MPGGSTSYNLWVWFWCLLFPWAFTWGVLFLYVFCNFSLWDVHFLGPLYIGMWELVMWDLQLLAFQMISIFRTSKLHEDHLGYKFSWEVYLTNPPSAKVMSGRFPCSLLLWDESNSSSTSYGACSPSGSSLMWKSPIRLLIFSQP